MDDKLFGIDVSKGVSVPVEHHKSRERGKKPPVPVEEVQSTVDVDNGYDNFDMDFSDVDINVDVPSAKPVQRDIGIDVQPSAMNEEKGGV